MGNSFLPHSIYVFAVFVLCYRKNIITCDKVKISPVHVFSPHKNSFYNNNTTRFPFMFWSFPVFNPNERIINEVRQTSTSSVLKQAFITQPKVTGKPELPIIGYKERDLGEACSHNQQCRTPNAECRNNRCECKPEHDSQVDDYGVRKCYQRANFDESCQYDVQCEWMSGGDAPLVCMFGKCACLNNYVFVRRSHLKLGCYMKATLFGSCEVSEQCTMANTLCSANGKCVCEYGYHYRNREGCVQNDLESTKAKEVYTAAMIAAACLMVAVLGILLTCIIRRSFCTRRNGTRRNGQDSSRSNDVFTISDELGALRAVDKPPTYEEVMQREREIVGIPPPEYTDAEIHRSFSPVPRLSGNVFTLRNTSDILHSGDPEGAEFISFLIGSSHQPSFGATIQLSPSPSESVDTQCQEHANSPPNVKDDSNNSVTMIDEGAASLPSTSSEGYYDNPTFHPD
ncbi:uncharacterized protein LOC106464226 isoform X2 [Limulus polyphemus]|uniref:Uncharacterized protein LOC106464226 isoform X2 n=1 Tax=Limulus polyphemus TaxID=6850 RepID=A0ABM1SVI9_LIMPO|nr:uncharacterized protein LOC106464226 isoform X2 [Limulus polyphemus]